jgi:hypothetical protein
LFQALQTTAAQQGKLREVHTPKTDEEIFIDFEQRHMAVVRGRLAEQPAKSGQPLRGVLVKQQSGRSEVMHPDDLATFTKMTAGEGMISLLLAGNQH